ncbi:hypothetical protein GW17_00007922 [Ensete ventricosum]|nr:hypothetical protein GW17_00007922 [Ensete ventricosum]
MDALNVLSEHILLNFRQLFSVQDGGTVALDWLLASDAVWRVPPDTYRINRRRLIEEEKGKRKKKRKSTSPVRPRRPRDTHELLPPSLPADHPQAVAALVARGRLFSPRRETERLPRGERDRGDSDCFYNAGWTEDFREVVNYLHYEYWRAPLFAVGTSIGANILVCKQVKYLGEDGENTPIAGAVSVCSPWDLVQTVRALFGTLTVTPLAMLESMRYFHNGYFLDSFIELHSVLYFSDCRYLLSLL